MLIWRKGTTEGGAVGPGEFLPVGSSNAKFIPSVVGADGMNSTAMAGSRLAGKVVLLINPPPRPRLASGGEAS